MQICFPAEIKIREIGDRIGEPWTQYQKGNGWNLILDFTFASQKWVEYEAAVGTLFCSCTFSGYQSLGFVFVMRASTA